MESTLSFESLSLVGTTDTVANTFIKIIEDLSDISSRPNFFHQIEREHLTQYIYLLKEHDVYSEPVVIDLFRMYDDPMLVRSMHLKLKECIFYYVNTEEERDEEVLKQLEQIDEWFEFNLVQYRDRKGQIEVIQSGQYIGMTRYTDTNYDHIVNLRNVLDILSTQTVA